MNSTSPDRMDAAAIVAEISTLQQELQSRLIRIQGLSQSLYQRVRRAPADDNTSVYMRFATTWSRFAGMATQGVKRASAVDRILRGLADPRGAESTVKTPLKQVPVVSTSVESLLEMYTEDSDLTDSVIESVVSGDTSAE